MEKYPKYDRVLIEDARFTHQVRHLVYLGSLWERDTIPLRLKNDVACGG